MNRPSDQASSQSTSQQINHKILVNDWLVGRLLGYLFEVFVDLSTARLACWLLDRSIDHLFDPLTIT